MPEPSSSVYTRLLRCDMTLGSFAAAPTVGEPNVMTLQFRFSSLACVSLEGRTYGPERA